VRDGVRNGDHTENISGPSAITITLASGGHKNGPSDVQGDEDETIDLDDYISILVLTCSLLLIVIAVVVYRKRALASGSAEEDDDEEPEAWDVSWDGTER